MSRSRYRRPSRVLGLGIALAWLSGWAGFARSPLYAQRPRDGLLIVAPIPSDRQADSAYVVEFAEELRQGLRRWRRHAVRMIWFCLESPFCESLLSDDAAYLQARSLWADVYVVGRFRRASESPAVDLRIMETGQRGGIAHLATRLIVQGDGAIPPAAFAETVGEVLRDTLPEVMDAADAARTCWERVGEGDYDGARAQAENAFRRYSNHPSAATCLSYVFAFTDQRDSLIWVLERAVAGDSTLADAWERLGQEYLRSGDTSAAVSARVREVEADPGDEQRRLRVVRLLHMLGRHDTAVGLVRQAAGTSRTEEEFRPLLARMCLQYEMWRCALDALAEQYASDSSLVGDTTFYYQVISLSQTLADTAAVNRWTQEAVQQTASVALDAWRRVDEARSNAERVEEVLCAFRLARAATLGENGRQEAALAVYREVLRDDPENVVASLAAARLLTDERFLVLEPEVPLDSGAVAVADSMLEATTANTESREVREGVARTYFDVGSRMVQRRVSPQLAAVWLDKAMRLDPDTTMRVRASAFKALALVYVIQEVDGRVRSERTCELVNREATLIDDARAALAPFEREMPQLAEQVRDGLDSFEELLPELRRLLQCAVTEPEPAQSSANEIPVRTERGAP